MRCLTSSSFARRGREGLALALFWAASFFGCFRDPKVDVTQPRHCESDKSCPYGFVCGPDGLCCASSDGKTCTVPPPSTGGSGGQVDGSSGNDAPADMPPSEASPGFGGTTGFAEVGIGTGGAPGSGGAIDGRGAGGGAGGVDRDVGPDSPLGGASGLGGAALGGALAGGGVSGSGGVTGPGGTVGSGGLAPTGGTHASGGATGTGATGSGGTGRGGTGSGGTGTGGAGTGGTGTGGQTGCGGSQKPCNGGCIATSECCGGCSGNTPICTNGTCVGKPNGSSCTTATAAQCATGTCADDVCCNVACTGKCEACNLSPAGTCLPSTTPRSGQTCNSDGSSCGGSCDGTEAHRLDCYYPPATTQCAPARCDSTANKDYNARFCGGDGTCKAATQVHDCGAYGCGTNNLCASSCPNSNEGVCGGDCVDIQSSPTHCGTGCVNCPTSTPTRPVCVGGSCVQCSDNSQCSGDTPVCNTSTHTCVGCLESNPTCTTRLDRKHVCYNNTCVECTAPENCSSYPDTPVCYGTTCVECTQASSCTSRFGQYATCDGAHHCKCRAPSSTNLLAQGDATSPGFDEGMGAWTDNTSECGACTTPLSYYDSTRDADSPKCPLSGSGRITYWAFFLGSIRRCVTASSGRYYLGYGYLMAPLDPSVLNPDDVYMDCQAEAYQGTTCQGDVLATLTVPILVGQLSGTFASTSPGHYFNAPLATASIRVSCNLRGIGDAWVDWVYLNTSDSF
jgi:hypothetical protein